MIQNASTNHVEEILNFIVAKNRNPKYHSLFMTNNLENMKRDIVDSIQKRELLISTESDKIVGLLCLSKYDPKSSDMDVSGPYTNNDFEIAMQMLNFMKKRFNQINRFNFFFEYESGYYRTVMEQNKATFNGYEFLLTLSRDNLKQFNDADLEITIMNNSEKEVVANMHETIFPDVYINSDMVIESKDVYVLKKENEIIGYALLKTQINQLYLELFGILEHHRGNGYAKPFLSYVLRNGFLKTGHKTCKLVVDLDNETAVNLYTDIGFTVESKNCSYSIKREKKHA